MLTWITQLTLQASCAISARKFHKNRYNLENVQREKLRILLKQIGVNQRIHSWEEFTAAYPVTRYSDWHQPITEQRSQKRQLIDSPLVRYQPTSGSSEKLKLIPYTRLFLNELDAAICPWLASLYKNYPAIKNGVHYWSVSWLPQNQLNDFKGNLNDDSELLGGIKRFIMTYSQAVSSDVALTASPQDSLFATLCYLVAKDNLSVLSVWSPTFALQLFSLLHQQANEVAQVLQTGNWGNRQTSLQHLRAPKAPKRAQLLLRCVSQPNEALVQTLWPKLALISAWDTADAKRWAIQLKELLPQAEFEGKGLWATEGVVSIPVDGQYPLAYRSHVYEFERVHTGEIVPPWQLQEGDEVSPIISCGNGILRYAMDDCLKVTGFWGKVPCFAFLGRRNGVDLVGEKMSPEAARQALNEIEKEFDIRAVSLLALDSKIAGQSSYKAIFSTPNTLLKIDLEQINTRLETHLKQHFHYALARELHQLNPASVLLVQDGWKLYQELAMASGMIEGNIKPEALRKMNKDIFDRFFQKEMEVA